MDSNMPPKNKERPARARPALADFRWPVVCLLLLLVVLASCGDNSTPTGGKGANFGDNKNHIHSMLALPGTTGTLLLATHRGLFRTTDSGKTWKEVLAGPGQLAEGLMTINLTVSPLNPQRVYVEAVTFPDLPASSGVPGIYTSSDGGATWTLAAALNTLPSPGIYYMVAGASSEQQLFVDFNALQEKGLYETMDAGAHWQQAGSLPDAQSLGLVVDPGNAQHLFTYSLAGLFATTNGGADWHPAQGIKDGITKALLSGSMLYASGDDGTFVSQDGGAHFTLSAPDTTFQFLAGDTSTPTTAFGLSGAGLNGSALYVTTDGGKTWQPVDIPADHLLAPGLTVDPNNGSVVYLGNSYPVAVYSTTDSGQHWAQIAP
jgi:photosystem II stability/assembly factor-like uncharacterized protein